MNEEKFRIKDGFVLREIAGEFIAVPVNACGNSVGMIVLNPVSALIWKTLQTEQTLIDLADKISSEFDVSRDEAERDIIDFLKELHDLDFLV